MAALPAQNGTNSTTTPSSLHSFGATNCPQTVPCPDSGVRMPSSSDMADSANICVSQNLFLKDNGDGFFEKSSGLDSNDCLTTNAAALSGKAVPQCCIAKLSDSHCVFRCELLR
jgi:hypothetical protein